MKINNTSKYFVIIYVPSYKPFSENEILFDSLEVLTLLYNESVFVSGDFDELD